MIEDLTNKLLDKLLKNISTPENIQKIQLALLDPVISYTYNRIYPYFILVLVILVILLKKIIY